MKRNLGIVGTIAVAIVSGIAGCNDNSSETQATDDHMTLGQEVTGTASSTERPEYKIAVQAGHAYGIQLETVDGDANMYVRNDAPADATADNVVVRSYASVEFDGIYKEGAGFVAANTGTYYLEVRHTAGITQSSSSYKLLVTDNSAQVGNTYSGNFFEEPIYYRFDSNGGAFTADLTVISGEAHLYIWDGSPDDQNSSFVGAFDTGSDTVTISAPSNSSTPYYIEVVPPITPQATQYQLTVTQ